MTSPKFTGVDVGWNLDRLILSSANFFSLLPRACSCGAITSSEATPPFFHHVITRGTRALFLDVGQAVILATGGVQELPVNFALHENGAVLHEGVGMATDKLLLSFCAHFEFL